MNNSVYGIIHKGYNKMSESQKQQETTQRIARQIQDMQSPIATIEICVHLISEEFQNENLANIRLALEKIRAMSKKFIEIG